MKHPIFHLCFFSLLLTGCSQATKTDGGAALRLLSRKEEVRIVVDAGHGGKDEGTRSVLSASTLEKELTLSTAKAIDSYLERFGYFPLLTRHRDLYIPLDLRAEFANANRAALFVSIHYNAAPNKSAQGVEVYYYRSERDLKRSAKSKALAQAVLERVVALTGAKSRGVKHGNFAVLRQTDMPAILIEAGFLSNKEEAQKIHEPAYRNRISLGIAQGVRDYLQDK